MKLFKSPGSPGQIQSRLLRLACIFLFLYAIILTLAPAARNRTWAAEYPWIHWMGFVTWVVIFTLIDSFSRKWLPGADPFIIPIAATLTGWGLLTIYRLVPGFGLRQTAWLVVCGILFILGMRLSPHLRFLRRYKYLLLTGGLLLTALTLILGKNPTGYGLRLWLGCCGIYLQPSEPLKLLLIIFLAAYLADHLPLNLRPLALLAPTAVLVGLAMLLLFIQRDLGTASIFIFLYAIIFFIATGKKRILLFSLFGLAIAGVAGYFLFDLIRLRVDAWFNPWLDPSGRSFQIVQSLMAVANGGVIGRGPGLGSPGLVPVAISDFVFTAIAEETGLVGTLALLGLIGFYSSRGIRIALRAQDTYRRFLAAGLIAYLGAQSILIIGGNIRLLPLTGVTLPFISYGGSSLLTSFIALLFLLLISSQPEEEPAPLSNPQPYLILAGLIGVGLCALAIVNAWWATWRSSIILERTDNARLSISDRYIKRGSILDRHENPINLTQGEPGTFVRTYLYPYLGSVAGYTNINYGQSGLEASLDSYLRGLQGNPASSIWWDHLLYGQPPPGLDVRLSLDLGLQRQADNLLGGLQGAIVLINAASGEILVLASHPSFDPNNLDIQASALFQDPHSPFLDRAAQGQYPPGDALLPFVQASGNNHWQTKSLFEKWSTALGFNNSPELRLPVAIASKPGDDLLISPLQLALAASALSNHGIRPAPILVVAINSPIEGWIILPPLSEPVPVFASDMVTEITERLIIKGLPIWQWNARVSKEDQVYSWSLGGTLASEQSTPLAVAVLLEKDDPDLAGAIGRALLETALNP